MRHRKSARLLIINNINQVLLFQFSHTKGSLKGKKYWATPGGGLEKNETFEQAAVRELMEETGLKIDNIGNAIHVSCFPLQLPNGEYVMAEEQFFLIQVNEIELSFNQWTSQETETITDCRFWSQEELRKTVDTVWPENLLLLLSSS